MPGGGPPTADDIRCGERPPSSTGGKERERRRGPPPARGTVGPCVGLPTVLLPSPSLSLSLHSSLSLPLSLHSSLFSHSLSLPPSPSASHICRRIHKAKLALLSLSRPQVHLTLATVSSPRVEAPGRSGRRGKALSALPSFFPPFVHFDQQCVVYQRGGGTKGRKSKSGGCYDQRTRWPSCPLPFPLVFTTAACCCSTAPSAAPVPSRSLRERARRAKGRCRPCKHVAPGVNKTSFYL